LETAIGVFDSRASAERAIRELMEREVPRTAILFLTGSPSDAAAVARILGEYVSRILGGAVEVSLGAGASNVLMPALGRVFAMGFGAAGMLRMLERNDGVEGMHDDIEPNSHDEFEDAAFFRQVLRQGRSLIMVRSDVHQVTRAAVEVLDRLGLGMQRGEGAA
jgi:uncharacterized SAM-binding protein YcdF (DUF218 family)